MWADVEDERPIRMGWRSVVKVRCEVEMGWEAE
jgi:hypothetical protein